MKNKIVMVTGATNGIGYVTARELARMGAEVVLVSRSAARCQAAVEKIQAETGNQWVSYLAADLSSQAQIRSLVGDFLRRYDRLDVLVNNAGAYITRRQDSVDGIEMTFALNHLNYFLLTHLLLDALKASPSGRIVNVSSDAHLGARIIFEDLQLKRGYNGWQAYARSKLANVLFTYELARCMEGSAVTANVLHPGFVATGFARNNGLLFDIGMRLTTLFALTPEQGAQTSIYLASSPEVEGVSGQYFRNKKAGRSSPVSYDQTVARRLWQTSAEMVALNGK
jgi:NAD(P)-dependent dehydrogenase (short-subunit alcohol dehydrogenase family)